MSELKRYPDLDMTGYPDIDIDRLKTELAKLRAENERLQYEVIAAIDEKHWEQNRLSVLLVDWLKWYDSEDMTEFCGPIAERTREALKEGKQV